MRYWIAMLLAWQALAAPVVAHLTWTFDGQNVDGSDCLDCAGFNLYWGDATRSYTSSVTVADPNARSVTINLDVNNGDSVYFAMTTFDTGGHESAYSNEVKKTFAWTDEDLEPNAPVLDVTITFEVECPPGHVCTIQ